MADKRMFSKKITNSDAFLDMPKSAQALYFHLSMEADDEGFLNSPKRVMRMTGCTDDDFKILVAKRFILLFDSGLIVIKHWRINNLLRGDRVKVTQYAEERKLLEVKENGAYTWKPIPESSDNQLTTNCQPTDNQLSTNCQPMVAIDLDSDLDSDLDEDEDRGSPPSSPLKKDEFSTMKQIGGELGRGVVRLTDAQMEDLLNKLSLEEFDHYVSVIAECELKGKRYSKSHYQAILDMAAKDRCLQ